MIKRVLVATAAAALCVPALISGADASVLPVGPRLASPATFGFTAAGTHFTTSFFVPTVECTSPTSAVRFLVGMFDDPTGASAQAGVDVRCLQGQPRYHAWEKLPRSHITVVDQHVRPKDSLSFEISAVDKSVQVSIDDETAGWGESYGKSSGLHMDGAILRTSKLLSSDGPRRVAGFGKIHYTNTFVDHKPITSYIFRNFMTGSGGQVRISVSVFHRADGTASMTWLHR